MPGGVVFLVCIPTLSHEHQLIFGEPVKKAKKPVKPSKVDLKIKDIKSRHQLLPLGNDEDDDEDDEEILPRAKPRHQLPSPHTLPKNSNIFVSMETVVEELLKKLKVEHVIWCKDKANMYYEVTIENPSTCNAR